jgi:hypothetical protein
VFTLSKRIAEGFSSPEAAVEPFRKAAPSMQGYGYLKMPEGDLTRRRGSGRSYSETPIKVIVEQYSDRYSISLRIAWLAPGHQLVLCVTGVLGLVVTLFEIVEAPLKGVEVFSGLTVGIALYFALFCLNDFLIARDIVADFESAYDERSNQSTDPTFSSGTPGAGHQPRHP